MNSSSQDPAQAELNHNLLHHRRRNPRAGGWRLLAIGLAFGMGMMGCLAPSLLAGSLYWNTTGGAVNAASGSGTWDAGTNAFWTTSPVGGTLTTWVADSDAFFVTAGANTVTLSGLVELNSLQQATNGTLTTISPTLSTDTLQIDGSTGILNGVIAGNGALTINTAITLNTNITIIAGVAATTPTTAPVTITGPIGDGGHGYGITKLGASTLTLNTGTSTYTGPTIIGQGQLELNDPNSLGNSPLPFSPITIGQAGSALGYANLYLVESGSDGNTTIPRGSLTINGPTVTATTEGLAGFRLDSSSGGNTVESFPTWTLQAGMFRALFNTTGTGQNLQILISNVVRNPGTTLDFTRTYNNAAGVNLNIGASPISSLAANQINIVCVNPPAMIGAGGPTGSPTVSVVPWATIAAAADMPTGTGIGLAVPVTYDPVNGLRGLNTATETVALSSSLTDGTENARVTASLTLTGDTTVNSLWGTSGTVTVGTNTLTVVSGAIVANATYTIGASANDGILNFGTNEGIFLIANSRIITVASVITGSGGVTAGLDNLNQSSVSDLVFNGSNTYTGLTRITGNSQPVLNLKLGNSLALQNSTLDYNNYGGFVSFGSLTAATFGGLQGPQSLALPVALTLGGDGDSTTYSGIASGAGSLIKTGPGAFTLTGASTFTGGTTLSNGQLNINYGGSSSANSAIGTGALTLLGGTLDNTSGSAVTLAPNNAQIWNRNFTFNGTSSLNLGSGAVTLAGNSQVTVNANTLTVGGAIGGSGALTLAGNGTLALSGAGTYAGNTIVSGGTLALTGSGAVAGTPGITVSNGATFDVSGLSSTFTLGGSQALFAGGTINGSVNASSGSAVYPDAGTPLSYGTNTFKNNLTLAGGATANFDLGAAFNGANDLSVVDGNLTLNGNRLHIKAPSVSASLDTADYTLFTVAGTLSGSFAVTPIWDVQPVNYNQYTVVTSAHAVTLHYNTTMLPEGTSSFNPSTVKRTQNTTLTVTVAPGTYPISSVTLDASPIGGSSSVTLEPEGVGSDVYTNTVTVGAGISAGTFALTVSITDNQSDTSTIPVPLTVLFGTAVWNGNGTDGNWSDSGNWVGGAGPLNGDAVVFAGNSGVNPVMDQSYSVSSVTFSNNAASFLVTNANGSTLTLGNGITDNSVNPQAFNVPILLSTSQAFNTAAGTLALGGVVSGSLAVLTNVGTGAMTLSGSNTYGGGTTLSSGTLVVAGDGALGGGVLTLAGGSISNSAGMSYTVANNVKLAGAANVVVGSNDTFSLAGTIAGSGNLTELGGGSLLLSSANTYSGGTTVNSAILVLGNNAALGASLLTLDSGAFVTNALGGSYSIGNAINLAGPAEIDMQGATTLLTLTGVITNVGSLTLGGNGTVSMAGTVASTYSGGTVLNAGTLDVEDAKNPLGTGTLTLAGGTLEDNSGNNVTLTNSIATVTNTTTTLTDVNNAIHTLNLAGNISGPGNLTVTSSSQNALMELSGTNVGYTGTFTVVLYSVYPMFVMGSASAGSSNAAWVFNGGPYSGGTNDAQNFDFGAGTNSLGSLSGNGDVYNTAAALTTLSIGGLNLNATWNGVLVKSGGNFGVIKVGTGLEFFSGNNPGFTGLDEVAAGTNEITTVSQTANPVQVDDGATFGVLDTGSGASAQVSSMVVGTNKGGNLFFDQPLYSGVPPIYITGGTMTANGVCTVTLADTFELYAGMSIQPLISYSAFAGPGHFVLAPLPNGLVGGLINDPNYGGLLLSVPTSQVSTPTNLTMTTTVSGGVTTLNISWPADHQGWALESNNVGLSDDNAWVVVSGSEYGTSESINVDPTQTSVFYRLALP